MTRKAIISQAEMKRMADVATSEGVIIEVEREGTIVRVMPLKPESTSPRTTKKPGEFQTIAEWQAWRDQQRDETPQQRAKRLLEPLGKSGHKRGLGRGPKA